MTIELYQADCLEWLKSQPTNSLDLVITSPPYENRRKYAELDFSLYGQKWVDWCVERWIECNRVCKGLVAWVVEGKTEKFQWSATPALLMADLHRAGIKLRKPPAYCRSGIPGSGGPDWLRNDFELIVCSSKGRLPWSDNTAVGHIPKWAPGGEMSYRQRDGARRNKWGKSPKQVSGTSGNRNRDGSRDDLVRPGDDEAVSVHVGPEYVAPALANPGNLIKVSVGGSRMGHPLAHENKAPFSLELAKFFVKSFCPPGGIVADIFAGSSTTGQACMENGRNYVGIDLRMSQIELSKRRLGLT